MYVVLSRRRIYEAVQAVKERMAENKNPCGSHELQLKELEKGVVCPVGLNIIELIKQNGATCLS